MYIFKVYNKFDLPKWLYWTMSIFCLLYFILFFLLLCLVLVIFSTNGIRTTTCPTYSAPLSVRECKEKQNNQTVSSQPDQSIEPDNYSNLILVLDLDSGEIKW